MHFKPMLLKLFQKMKRESMFPNSFYQVSITLISKLHKNTTNKEKEKRNYRSICLMSMHTKISIKIFEIQTQIAH
jgi:hypothetical protein